jgi:hypothetical protein
VYDLHLERLAVFYLGLAQAVVPVLAGSPNYVYADRAMARSWAWIEERAGSMEFLLQTCHDDDDYGVEPAMFAETDPVRWNAWGCVVEALLQTAYCAHVSEGEHEISQVLESCESEEVFEESVRLFRGADGPKDLPSRLASFLATALDSDLSRVRINNIVEEVYR